MITTIEELIRPGITGIVSDGHEDLNAAWKLGCKRLAGILQGPLHDEIPATVGRNYSSVSLTGRGREPVSIIKHATLPIIAFCPIVPLDLCNAGNWVFQDLDGADVCFGGDLRIVSAELLNERLNWRNVDQWGAALSIEERREVWEWRPDSVGELVFNHYD